MIYAEMSSSAPCTSSPETLEKLVRDPMEPNHDRDSENGRNAREIENLLKVNGDRTMIARHGRGWTRGENANAYEELLKEKVLPNLRKDLDYGVGYVLRCDGPEETEFVVVNVFDSREAVRRFAGEDYTVATFEQEAKLLLSRKETLAMHYEVRASPENFGRRQWTS
jgi:quinol monooxygenase YgiN